MSPVKRIAAGIVLLILGGIGSYFNIGGAWVAYLFAFLFLLDGL